MAIITSKRTDVFVTYTIKPISAAFKDALEKHLTKFVCNKRREWNEHLSVMVDVYRDPNNITSIRYQFGTDFDDYMADDVEELIEEEINAWLCKASIADVMEA